MILFYGSTSLPQHCMSNVVQLRHCRIAKEQSRILGSTFFFQSSSMPPKFPPKIRKFETDTEKRRKKKKEAEFRLFRC